MPLSFTRFDLATVPEAERFTVFRHTLSATHDITRRDGDERPFEACSDAWFLDRMVLTRGRHMGACWRRGPERIAADGLNHINVLLMLEGSWSGRMGGIERVHGDGTIFVFDTRQPIETVATDNRHITLSLPREMVMGDGAQACGFHGRALEGTAGRLLADFMMSLADRLPAMTQDDAAIAVDLATLLLRSCLAAAPPAPKGQPDALLARAVGYIDAHLDAELAPARIAAALSVSRATLYRAFRPLGGIAALSRARRLEAVHVLLTDAGERRSISDLAHNYGFVSDAHFSSVFRRRYGFSPRQARRTRIHPGGQNDLDRYRAWLAQAVGALKTPPGH